MGQVGTSVPSSKRVAKKARPQPKMKEAPQTTGLLLFQRHPHRETIGGGYLEGMGVDSRGIQPSGSFSAPEEIERFAHWRGTIGQRQTVQMTAIFEIPRDALPAQAHVMSFGRPVGFD